MHAGSVSFFSTFNPVSSFLKAQRYEQRPDAARPIRRVTRFSRQKVACVAKGEIRGKEVAMKYMFSRFFVYFFFISEARIEKKGGKK